MRKQPSSTFAIQESTSMDWDQFDAETRRLGRKITDVSDIIVAIARGGVIPGALLAKLLDVKDMFILTMRRDGGAKIFSLSKI